MCSTCNDTLIMLDPMGGGRYCPRCMPPDYSRKTPSAKDVEAAMAKALALPVSKNVTPMTATEVLNRTRASITKGHVDDALGDAWKSAMHWYAMNQAAVVPASKVGGYDKIDDVKLEPGDVLHVTGDVKLAGEYVVPKKAFQQMVRAKVRAASKTIDGMSMVNFVAANFEAIEKVYREAARRSVVRDIEKLIDDSTLLTDTQKSLHAFDLWAQIEKEFGLQKKLRQGRPAPQPVAVPVKVVERKPRVLTGDERRAVKRHAKALAKRKPAGALPAAAFNAWEDRMGHGSSLGPHNVLLAMSESSK